MFFMARSETMPKAKGQCFSPAPSTLIHCDITARIRSLDSCFDLQASFSVQSKRIAFFGPSGSGKSLTLMALAGLLAPRCGTIILGERTFFDSHAKINIPAHKRRIGMVFQDYALFPHLTVRENVAFALKRIWGPLRGAERARVEELLTLCDLLPLAKRKPSQISGGQRQRTALARALALNPDLLLLDEPFSALDQPLRQRMREELSVLLERFNLPMILVSHDLDDIDHFAQTLVAFGHGRILDVIDYATLRQTQSAHSILNPLYLAAQG